MSGILASLSGCVLPVFGIIAYRIAKEKNFNPLKFVFSFFLAQFAIFALINMSISAFYALFREAQPVVMLLAGVITLYTAVSNYLGKTAFNLASGSLYAIALAPCNLGFLVYQASTSRNFVKAVANAFSFALGVSTPLALVAFFSNSFQKFLSVHGEKIETASFILLVLISYYLAYLAGSTWRWVP